MAMRTLSRHAAQTVVVLLVLYGLTACALWYGPGRPEPTAAPDTIGLTQASAVAALGRAGLTLGVVSQSHSGTVNAGLVISQNPAAGTMVTKGSAIDLVISLGPEEAVSVAVPDTIGLTQASAVAALAGMGLTLGAVSQTSSATIAGGSVVSQNPIAGAVVTRGTAVSLVISSGPEESPTVTVPDTIGLTQASATAALTGRGLTLGAVTETNSTTVAVGSVISQIPVAEAVVARGTAVSLVISLGARNPNLPADPITVASLVDPTVPTDILAATAFLYAGDHAIQTGVATGIIEPTRIAVLRGKVSASDNSSLTAVEISVIGHPELGRTRTRADGAFDLAVNGGGPLTLRYEKDGFLALQRSIVVPLRDYAWLPDVVMIPFDTAVTAIDLAAGSAMQVARGSTVSDEDGVRRATILFPQGTTATMVLPDGSIQALSTLNVRATEYTVGTSGPKAMPAMLPPSSGYTYAAEFSVDESVAAGASEVRFSQALPVYVDNFLGFAVGSAVPTGYYDRQKGQWIASANGRVIKVLGVSDGLADLDCDGNGAADDAAALVVLGITTEERTRLAELYTTGHSLWRVPINHFSPWDCNWPYGPPTGAIAPPGRNPNKPAVDQSNKECGSIIGCEDQTLGETLPVTGTPFRLHYQSERTPGRKDAYILEIPLSGPTIPASLRAIRVEVSIAGRLYQSTMTLAPNLAYNLSWDGRDGYGRLVQGTQTALIQVHYDYSAQYYDVNSSGRNSFARVEAIGVAITSARRSSTITLSKAWNESVVVRDTRSLGLGGWSLNAQHVYDRGSHTLFLGDGRRRSEALLPIITTVAGDSDGGLHGEFIGDGGLAVSAKLRFPRGLAVGADGSIFIADSSNHRIRRVGRDGIINTVAGSGNVSNTLDGGGFGGDGGPAVAALLKSPQGVTVGPDGSIFIADSSNHRIRRVGLDGRISTVVGNGEAGFSGDGDVAVAARLNFPHGIAAGPDGSLWIADTNNHRVRRVGSDGVINTVVGRNSTVPAGDGGLASAARLISPVGVSVGPDGSLFIVDRDAHRVRRVGPDGIINTVAGNGVGGFVGDGGKAAAARLSSPVAIALAPDGTIAIADSQNHRIRRVELDGTINTVAGNGLEGLDGDGGSATAARLDSPSAVALGPDGSLFTGDAPRGVIRRVGLALSKALITEVTLPSEDGRELYVFNDVGRHLKTLDALTGGIRHQFDHDSGGYLTSVTNGAGEITTIERVGAIPTAIIAPGGQRTTLSVSDDGWLIGVTNTAGEAYTMSYSADGLLQHFVDPRANDHHFTYDELGRLTKDEDPVGGSTSLSRTEQSNGYTVTTTTALGRNHVYQVEQLPTGGIQRTVTDADGTKTVMLIDTDRSEQVTGPDGGVTTVHYGPDPRWGMLAPVATSVVWKSPSGLTRTVTAARTATLTNPADPFSLQTLTQSVTIDGHTFKSVYDSATRTSIHTSAEGRQSKHAVDALGRIIWAEVAGLLPTEISYDTHGRPEKLTRGTGANALTAQFGYNAQGYVSTITDPIGSAMSYLYDAAGRVKQQTLPDGSEIVSAYDSSGNVTSLTPPGRPAHAFTYTALDQTAEYRPPILPIGGNTLYRYDLDRRITRITRPDGHLVDFGYDGAGRLSTLTGPTGMIGYGYNATTGELTRITASDGGTTDFAYDGALLTRTSSTGTAAGSVGYSYDKSFRLARLDVNGAGPVAFTYDADGLLSHAGALTLTRDSGNGLLTGTTLGVVSDTLSYTDLGEVLSYTATVSETPVLSTRFTRDKLGRITGNVETVGGALHAYDYGYDLAGRLAQVKQDGVIIATYSYDGNGNRLTGPSVSTIASYDDQDRQLSRGGSTYAYTANGELRTMTAGAAVTSYTYDVLGNLTQVELPTGATIHYVIDGQNRRIGKMVNGVLKQGLLYQDGLRPIAELDESNTIISRFVYGTKVNIPEYMVRGGVTYRIVTDHLGSPRLVINTTNGAIVQRIDYDEFGAVLADSNPGFQPFGFAGGLYDRDTGLVRFGARDYDPQTGRWTAKDPIGFDGGDTSLYAYSASDPINWNDPLGVWRLPDYYAVNVAVGGLVGWSGTASIDRHGHWYWSPIGTTLAKPFPSPVSGSLTANWLDCFGIPSAEQLDSFLSELGFNVTGGLHGVGLSQSYTPGSGMATGIGVALPQVGGSTNWSFRGWGTTGLTW